MSRLGSYELLGTIAAGATATILRARSAAGDLVALKCLHPQLARSDEHVARFRRERAIQAAASGPGVPRILDHGSLEGVQFFAMEIVEGPTLAELLPERPEAAWPLEVAVAFVLEVGRVLRGVHERADARGPLRLVHGDVAPRNLIVDRDGRVFLIDFGVARSLRDDPFDPTPRGTHAYMAPETVLGRGADARADVFALGIVSFELVTGRRLFAGSSGVSVIRVVEEPIPDVCALRPNCPPALGALIHSVLARALPERMPSAGFFVDTLEELAAAEGWASGPRAVATWLGRGETRSPSC